ncbi:MAG: hypothetical protein IKP37_00610 [Paludibacteraceae bacterium]|nr:hypothetical protein [Paludibacteraceae bacterium]
MREFELYTRILNPTFESASQTCMEEVKADHSVKLITRGISEYRLYRFDLDSSDADFLCFFNKNHSAGSGVQGLKDLRCFCDYVLLAQKNDKLYVFIIELKSGKTEGAVEQLRATELFMDYIKETAERIKEVNSYGQFDAKNIITKKVVLKGNGRAFKPGSNPNKGQNIDWKTNLLYLNNNQFPILKIISNC